MSWKAGSQLTMTSLGVISIPWTICMTLHVRWSWLWGTPLGRPVLPDVYWM